MATLPAPVLAAAVAVALAVVLVGWSLFARPGAGIVEARENLVRGIELHGPTGPGRTGPGLLARLAGWLTPQGTLVRLNRLASTAGRPADWPVSKLVAGKLVLVVIRT